MADVELAVQVIGFVEEGAGKQFFSGFLVDLAVNVLGADGDFVRASDVLAEVGDAEASFALRVVALGVNDFGIDEDELGVWIFLEGDVDDGDAAADADLRARPRPTPCAAYMDSNMSSMSFCSSSSKTVTVSAGFQEPGCRISRWDRSSVSRQ